MVLVVVYDVAWRLFHHLVDAFADHYRINIIHTFGFSGFSLIMVIKCFITVTGTRWRATHGVLGLMFGVEVGEFLHVHKVVWLMMIVFHLVEETTRPLHLDFVLFKLVF